MLKQRTEKDPSHVSTIPGILILLLLAGTGFGPPATAADGACATAEPLSTDATVRREVPAAAGEFYEMSLLPGVLALDVASGIDEPVRPKLAVLGESCAEAPAAAVGVRETPRNLVLRIREATTLYVSVSPEDPEAALAAYTLRSSFAPESPAPDQVVPFATNLVPGCSVEATSLTSEPLAGSRFVVVERPPLSAKEVNPWDDEEVSGLTAEPGVIVVERDGMPIWVSLHRDGGCDTDSRLTEGVLDETGDFVAAAVHAGEQRFIMEPRSMLDTGYDLHVEFFPLCAQGDDRPLCGTPLTPGTSGVIVSGVIDDGTDDDYYTFTLDVQATMALEVSGDAGVRGVLYDDAGQRLDTWAGQLVRTLGVGRFHVRVGSVDGWGGDYTVGVEMIP